MKLLTLKQVKDITQIPESTLRKWSKENLFPAFKVGSSWRVDQEDLDIWLSDKKKGVLPTLPSALKTPKIHS